MTKDELRRLDAEVHRKVMGGQCEYDPETEEWYDTAPHHLGDGVVLPRYSEDIAAAWELNERMRQLGWLFHLGTLCNGYVVTGQQYTLPPSGDWQEAMLGHGMVQEVGDTAPEAICLAALTAVGVAFARPDGAPG